MHCSSPWQKPPLSACVLTVLLCCLTSGAVSAQGAPVEYLRSVELSPLSPLFRIYVIEYCHRVAPHGEFMAGPYYANIHYEDIGHTNAPGFLIGYRQYVWGKLHVEYQLIPQWDRFYEENEDRLYPRGFDLWNEFRLGYTWDFKLGSLPMFVNAQWPVGFALYSDDSAKPESFKKHVEEEPLFYFPPMFFVGARF